MGDFQVTVTAGDAVTLTASTATIEAGALIFGGAAASQPVGLFAAGQWSHAVDVTALPVDPPVPDPAPEPDPTPTPDPVPGPEPVPAPGQPE